MALFIVRLADQIPAFHNLKQKAAVHQNLSVVAGNVSGVYDRYAVYSHVLPNQCRLRLFIRHR